jgi:hypothetical protein
MIQTSSDTDPFAAIRARNQLVRSVRDQLKGKGLDIRELDKELVISFPGHPENGRLYLNLATGEVSHRRTIWEYLGYFDGHGQDIDSEEPTVDVQTIVHTLTEPDSPANPGHLVIDP